MVLGALAAFVILLAAAFVLVHTSVVTNYARTKFVRLAETRLGTPVHIQSLSIAWDQMAVEIRGLTIGGSGARSHPPLLQIPRLKVALAAGPLLRGTFQLSRVLMDRPSVYIHVDSNGKSNFPRPPSGGAGGGSSSAVNSLFSLAIGNLQISQATISYENAKIPVSADLADFIANVYFDRSDKYYGSLGYKSGRITVKNFEPVEHSADLRFSASRSGITCDPLTITLLGSRLTLYATARNYADPILSGRYDAQIATGKLAQALQESAIPAGTISTAGNFKYQGAEGSSFWDALRIRGMLSSSQVVVALRQFTAPVNDLRASYALENGALQIAGMRGKVLGGELHVDSGVVGIGGESASELRAVLASISLRAVSQALPNGPYRRLNLAGRADLIARVSWMPGFHDVVVDTNANIQSPPERQLTKNEIPLNGAIQIAYDRAHGQASLGNSQLRVGSTTIAASGGLSKSSNLMLSLTAGDLTQFSQLAEELVQTARPKSSPSIQMPRIAGSAQFSGRAYGSLDNPQVLGRLTARDLAIESTQWKTVQANVAVSPSRATLVNGSLILASEGRVKLDAAVGLRSWAMTPSSPISLRAAAESISISSLQNLASTRYPVTGVLSANVAMSGTRQHPVANGWIRVRNAAAWDQPLSLVSVNLQGDANTLHADLAAESPAGTVAATFVYQPASKTYQAKVDVPGLNLSKLEVVEVRRLPVRGTLVATGSGNGSIENPSFSINVATQQLEYRGQTITNFQSQVHLVSRQVNFTASAALYQGDLQTRGNLALGGMYPATATLDLHSISVGMLAARYLRQGQPAPQGQVDLHAELQGPLKEPSQLSVRAEVPAMTLEYRPVQIALTKPLVLNYRDGIAAIEPSELKGTGVDMKFAGQIPVKSSAAFNIAANGTVSLSLFQAMIGNFQSSGQVDVNIAAQGRVDQPNMQGDLRLQNVSLSTASFPIDLRGVNGDIRVAGRHVEITKLNGDVNGGSMTAQGSVDLGKAPAFDLAVAARSVGVNYPDGVRSRLDGDLRLNGSTAASALTGRVVVDYLAFTQQMDIATLASQFSSDGGGGTPSPFESRTKINVAVQSSTTLSLASSQLSIQGAANLDIVGTLADPVVLGRMTLTSGELFFLGKRYDIKGGTVEFANPTHTRPTVNLYAATTVNQYKLSLHFLGPVDEMKTTFTSTPPLAQADIINLLAFGQTTEAAATNPTPGGLGAESVLAQGVASQITGKIQKAAGISQLSITPVLGGTQQNPGAQVAIQQRVSGQLLVTFTANTAETQNTAVQVEYQLGHGLSVSALRDQNGGYGVDLRLHKSF